MPPRPVVRVATVDDLDLLIRLRRTWTDETGTHEDPSFPARFRSWFDQESARRTFWLVSLDDEPVGTGNLLEFERMPRPAQPAGRWGYLGNLFVLAEVRNRGAGSALLAAILRHADDHHYERVVLHPTVASRPLYARHGFGAADQLLLRPRPG